MVSQVQTLGSIFHYGTTKKYDGLLGNIPLIPGSKDIFLGVEIELENILMHTSPPSTWNQVEDHSLKIHGAEFVSVPLKFKYLEIELKRLFSCLNKNYMITPRCSTHIHVNAHDLTIQEVHKFLILYCIFEKAYFNFAGSRWTNNFTTPLFLAPEMVKTFLQSPFQHWYKYTALNLCPIWGGESGKKYGTIEFRHLGGCTDVDKIMTWCNLILALKVAAKKFSLEELDKQLKTLNTTSGYSWFTQEIFGDWSGHFTSQPTFVEDIESCIIRTKFIFYKNSFKTHFPKIPATPKVEEEELKPTPLKTAKAKVNKTTTNPWTTTAFTTTTTNMYTDETISQQAYQDAINSYIQLIKKSQQNSPSF